MVDIPAKALVFVEPEGTSWSQHFSKLVGEIVTLRWSQLGMSAKAIGVKWLSEGIVCLDGGRFSHVAIRNEGCAIDVSLSAGVSRFRYVTLEGLNRWLGYSVPTNDWTIDELWAAIPDQLVTEPCEEQTVADDTPLPDEEDRFSLAGMLRIGLLLVMGGGTIGPRIGRWLVSTHNDAPGMFCSELVAKAFLDAGFVLQVLVPLERVGPLGSLHEGALVDAVVARPEVNFGAIAAGRSEADLREAVLANFAAIRDMPTVMDGVVAVEVGYQGAGGGKYPPSLVTPRELFESPQVSYAVMRSPTGFIDDTRPVLSAGERCRRCRQWKRVTWLGVLAIVAGVGAVFRSRGRRRARRL